MDEHPIFWLIGLLMMTTGTTLAVVLYLLMRLGELHILLNSRLTELLRLNAAEATLRGRAEERSVERDHQEKLRG